MILSHSLLELRLPLGVSADCGLLHHQYFSWAMSHTVQYHCNLCLKGYSILSHWNVLLYFAFVFANSCTSPLLITGSISKPDMPFSQLFELVFALLFPSWYLYPIFTESALRVTWSFIILNLLSTLSAFTEIRLCPIPRFLWSGLCRQYVAINAADSTNIPSVGICKNISSTFIGVVLIAPVTIVHAALCRHSNSDLAKAMSHHATAAYVIIGIITHL